MGTIFEKLLLTSVVSDDVKGNDTLLYLLDSSGYVVWMSSSEQSQVNGRSFAKIQPVVFADMVVKGVFIVGNFMGYEPKPCKLCEIVHSITPACLDNAAFSMHKVCVYSF